MHIRLPISYIIIYALVFTRISIFYLMSESRCTTTARRAEYDVTDKIFKYGKSDPVSKCKLPLRQPQQFSCCERCCRVCIEDLWRYIAKALAMININIIASYSYSA